MEYSPGILCPLVHDLERLILSVGEGSPISNSAIRLLLMSAYSGMRGGSIPHSPLIICRIIMIHASVPSHVSVCFRLF